MTDNRLAMTDNRLAMTDDRIAMPNMKIGKFLIARGVLPTGDLWADDRCH